VPIFKKESERRTKKADHEGRGQEALSPLNIAPTLHPDTAFRFNNYYLKCG
jgi:hypothetical protein